MGHAAPQVRKPAPRLGIAPLGLSTSRFPAFNPANPLILKILIQTTNALRNPPNRDNIYRSFLQRSQSTMRIIAILSLLLVTSPAFAELTKEDIRTIVKEENAALEKRVKEYIDLKIETVNARIDAVEKSVDGRFDNANGYFDPFGNFDPFWIAMVMIVFLIILPQLIILYKEIRDRKKNWTQIQALREKIEAMSQ